MTVINYEKATDSISTKAVMKVLEKQRIGQMYWHILFLIVQIRLQRVSNKIQLEKRICLGDSLSPKLFSAWLEGIIKTVINIVGGCV